MWELDYKESWAPKNWCFWIVVLQKILKSFLNCREIQAVHPKGNQSWIFLGWTDAEAETPILWPPDVKNQLIGKDPDAGQDWRQEEKGMIEDWMVGWHHQLDGHEFEQVPRVGDGQVCCSPWGRKESDTTDWTTIYLLELMKYWELEENTKRLYFMLWVYKLWCLLHAWRIMSTFIAKSLHLPSCTCYSCFHWSIKIAKS